MAYSKQTWDTTSYVNPTRMNHIEDGIEDLDTASKKYVRMAENWSIDSGTYTKAFTVPSLIIFGHPYRNQMYGFAYALPFSNGGQFYNLISNPNITTSWSNNALTVTTNNSCVAYIIQLGAE